MQPSVWVSCDEIFWNLINSFDVWVAPSWANQNTQWKRILNDKDIIKQQTKLRRLLREIYGFFPKNGGQGT